MKLNSYEEVKKLTSDMVAIPSINKEPGGETAVAQFITDWYMDLPYFQDHPEQVIMFQTKDDFVERHSVISYVKGTKGNSGRTVILLGHVDTVGVDDFGTIREYAFDTENLPAKLQETFNLSDEVLEDIKSGEYMFGRGALDMKSGVAGHMYLMKYFSQHPEELDGNLLALAECDEEDNSKGVLTALDYLVDLKESEGFRYIACINSDYSTNYAPGDPNRYIYFGSIGKLLPCFVAFGKEAHVGQAFSAFDPNLLIAEVTRNISLNADLCDVAGGEVTIPPISLKQADTKVDYTVQTALVAHSYFNYFTHGISPDKVLEKCVKIGEESFENVIGYLNQQYEKYCNLSHVKFTQLTWKPRVYTWSTWYDRLAKEHGKAFTEHIHKFAQDLHDKNPELDLRLFSLKVAEEAWTFESDKSPMLLIYFGSVFSARIEMTGKTEMENNLLKAVEDSIEDIRPEAKRDMKIRMFYPYISDSSFMAISDTLESFQAVGDNMPSWKTKYYLDIQKVLKINVPVVNIGSFGKDGHMLTERVDMYHTFQNVPNITYETIAKLLA